MTFRTPTITIDDSALTPEELDGIRLALDEIDRGETFALEDVMDELREELRPLEQERQA